MTSELEADDQCIERTRRGISIAQLLGATIRQAAGRALNTKVWELVRSFFHTSSLKQDRASLEQGLSQRKPSRRDEMFIDHRVQVIPKAPKERNVYLG